MGENETFVGGEGILKAHGVEVVNLGKRETSVGSGVETRWATARPGGGGGGGGRTLTATPNSADLDSCKTLMKTFIKEHPEIWNEASVPRLQRSGGCVLTCDTRRLQDIGEE